jgi:hypothetical protein
LLAYGIGKKFYKWVGMSFHSDGEEILFSIALGLVCLSYLIFVLGLCKLLYIEIFYPLVGILFIILFPEARKFITTVLPLTKGFWKELKTNKVTILGIILLIYLGITFIEALAPPIDWDGTLFNLVFPKLSAQQHGLAVTSYNFYYNVLIQILYLPGLLLKEEISPQLFQWLMSVLTISALYLFMRKYFSVNPAPERCGVKTGIWAGLIFLTNPIVLIYSTIASVDMSLCFYLFLTAYTLFEWFFSNPVRESNDKGENNGHSYYDNIPTQGVGTGAKNIKWLWLSGIFGGCALGIKYSASVFLGLLVIGCFVKCWLIDRERFITTIKWIGLFIGITFLLSLPWYIRGYCYTGNPLFPLGDTVCVGVPFNPHTSVGTAVVKEVIDYFLFPWHITMIKLADMESMTAFSPLFLALIPCLFFLLKGVNQTAKYLIFYCCGVITILFFIAQYVRYMMPLLPLLSILAAYALEKLIIQSKPRTVLVQGKLTQKVVSSVFALVLFMNFILLGMLVSYHLPAALGLESRDRFLAQRIDIYPACHYINTHPDKIQTVLIFDERGYYCDLPHIIGLPFVQKATWVNFHQRGYLNPYWIDYWSFKNSDEMLKRFKELDISHILINLNRIESQGQKEAGSPFLDLFNELQEKQQLELVFSENNVFLYNIRYK